jgi:hypothetical protein
MVLAVAVFSVRRERGHETAFRCEAVASALSMAACSSGSGKLVWQVPAVRRPDRLIDSEDRVPRGDVEHFTGRMQFGSRVHTMPTGRMSGPSTTKWMTSRGRVLRSEVGADQSSPKLHVADSR